MYAKQNSSFLALFLPRFSSTTVLSDNGTRHLLTLAFPRFAIKSRIVFKLGKLKKILYYTPGLKYYRPEQWSKSLNMNKAGFSALS